MPSFKDRELSIAHSILRTVLNQGKEEPPLVAYVGREHLIGVTKQIMHLLNKGEDFMKYKRPPKSLEDPRLTSDRSFRLEMIKRHALGTAIYDEGGQAETFLPFVHSRNDVQT